MRGGRPGAGARAQGLGAGGAEHAEPGRRGRAAGGRGRGRAPPAASPCPSPRGGCIAERQGSAPPWCSSDSCTNPENRIKRKGKVWQRRLPLPSTLMLNPRFLRGGLFQEGLWPRVGREKPLLRAPSGERLRSFALDTGCWGKAQAGYWRGRRAAGRALRAPSFTEGHPVFRPQSWHLPIAAPFPKPAASSIDPIRAAAPGSARVSQCAGDAIWFSATWPSPPGARQARIYLPCAQCRQARSKFGGCLTASSSLLWIFLFDSSPFLGLLY